MDNQSKSMSAIVNHLKHFGFVFQSSEIYGGLANTWDYGPLGVLMINKIKQLWWKEFIDYEVNNVGLDSKILLNPQVWHASGHVANFHDPVIENKINNKRYRADHLYEAVSGQSAAHISLEDMQTFIWNNIKEYEQSKTDWSPIMNFNLMFQTWQGVNQAKQNQLYLRPETAQGIFINFNNVCRALRLKLPFGIGQIGKSFRNEVTPGNFIFRTREFEQMELEYFTFSDQAETAYQYYVEKAWNFLLKLGLKSQSLRKHHHSAEELAHYARATVDIEFAFCFGWNELMGIANRGDFDLKAHNEQAYEAQKYFDPATNQFLIPAVIEPSLGVDRLLLAILTDAYEEEILANEDQRLVLRLKPELSPYQVAVLPLVKKQAAAAQKLVQMLLRADLQVAYDEAGSIGKRYRRQDAIGTPWVITYDYDSDQDQMVTIRERDSMQQKRLKISEVISYIKNQIKV